MEPSEQTPYPPYVVTPEQRRRWDAAGKAAAKVSEMIGGNETTVWLATRSLYKSDIPTGFSPETLEPKTDNPSDE